MYDSMTLVYVTIDNSGHKLTQQDWADFSSRVRAVMDVYASRVHGAWSSAGTDPFQSACYGFEVARKSVKPMQAALESLRASFQQDSITWAEAEMKPVQPAQSGWRRHAREMQR